MADVFRGGKSEALARYRELTAKVDAFVGRALSALGGRMSCRPGCDSCCGKAFSVFHVEAAGLLEGFGALGADKRALVQRRAAERRAGAPCVLLEGGLCLLYAHRPLICRTHGLPIRVGGRLVNPCPRNLKGIDLQGLPRTAVLDADRLNTVLAAVNLLYMKEAGLLDAAGASSGRVELAGLFTR